MAGSGPRRWASRWGRRCLSSVLRGCPDRCQPAHQPPRRGTGYRASPRQRRRSCRIRRTTPLGPLLRRPRARSVRRHLAVGRASRGGPTGRRGASAASRAQRRVDRRVTEVAEPRAAPGYSTGSPRPGAAGAARPWRQDLQRRAGSTPGRAQAAGWAGGAYDGCCAAGAAGRTPAGRSPAGRAPAARSRCPGPGGRAAAGRIPAGYPWPAAGGRRPAGARPLPGQARQDCAAPASRGAPAGRAAVHPRASGSAGWTGAPRSRRTGGEPPVRRRLRRDGTRRRWRRVGARRSGGRAGACRSCGRVGARARGGRDPSARSSGARRSAGPPGQARRRGLRRGRLPHASRACRPAPRPAGTGRCSASSDDLGAVR